MNCKAFYIRIVSRPIKVYIAIYLNITLFYSYMSIYPNFFVFVVVVVFVFFTNFVPQYSKKSNSSKLRDVIKM